MAAFLILGYVADNNEIFPLRQLNTPSNRSSIYGQGGTIQANKQYAQMSRSIREFGVRPRQITFRTTNSPFVYYKFPVLTRQLFDQYVVGQNTITYNNRQCILISKSPELRR